MHFRRFTIVVMFVALILCVCMLNHGCTSDQEVLAEDTHIIDALPDGTKPQHLYLDLDFGLTFPEEWVGRYVLERENQCVTVNIDNTPVYSFVSFENAPGAHGMMLRLKADGYTFWMENGTDFFWYKIHADLPEDLYPYKTLIDHSAQWQTEEAMAQIWQVNTENEVCSVRIEATPKESLDRDVYLSMKQPEYINHMLGISFTLTPKMMDNPKVYLESNTQSVCVHIVAKLSYGIYKKNAAHKDIPFAFPLCSVLAKETREPTRPDGDWYNTYDYPHLLLLGRKIYGIANEWCPLKEGVFAYYEWNNYPWFIRNDFTYEDVQQVVYSFRMLISPDKLNVLPI